MLPAIAWAIMRGDYVGGFIYGIDVALMITDVTISI